ncbi:MAG: TrmH family RNA methyltransferase [Gallionellaceae bacterium]
MKLIRSRDNPFFRELLKLADSARQRTKSGQALLDGTHLLSAYLDSNQFPRHILLNEVALHNDEIAGLLSRMPDVPVAQLDHKLFSELSELKTPTGILALIDIPQPAATIADIGFALLLQDIQDPGNLGSILRSAAAAACDAVFLSSGCADAWSPRVLRAGMGGHFVLGLYESANLLAVARSFRGRVYAAALEAKESLFDCDLRGNLAFAIGNEGAGLSAGLLALGQPVAIPMPGRVESLNAAAAAAVCLFESVRQRR